jgi:PAS domain S-box-containing protein
MSVTHLTHIWGLLKNRQCRFSFGRASAVAILVCAIMGFGGSLGWADQTGTETTDVQAWITVIVIVIAVGVGAVFSYRDQRIRNLEREVARKDEALQQSEEQYRSLVESSEDFIFTIDARGHFQSLNNFTARFFGGTPSQFVGKPLTVLFSKDVSTQLLQLVEAVFQFGKSVRHEFMVTTGEYQVWLSANFMPFKDEQNNMASVLCIARDVTEQKKLENQLINTEKMASMGTLAAGVAHELNNPLGVILGFTDLLLEKVDKKSQDHEDLKTIERHSLHCKQVVENLLSFARQGDGLSAYCDIYDAIHEIIGVVSHSMEMNHIKVRLQLSPGLPKVKGDARQIQQVFLNLINNAAAAMNGGGTLELQAALDKNAGRVRVTVRDDGHGIEKDHIQNIFDPFFTTKPEGEGTGLGLFVSHGIVTRYEGTITCESSTVDTPQKQKGTTFTVTLKTRQR